MGFQLPFQLRSDYPRLVGTKLVPPVRESAFVLPLSALSPSNLFSNLTQKPFQHSNSPYFQPPHTPL